MNFAMGKEKLAWYLPLATVTYLFKQFPKTQ